ncbi:hypothetical protein JKP88DRAFT_168941 [Tribonema minus]|uniref:39S ribosomal protein L46, mitochondrial n=1 Tax=Tribonema minus TaxID=303371 RepID=A0A835YXA6_9STRA|nr:hypothetical protein JKP88DRAFT_168941 [Tribonema minus]
MSVKKKQGRPKRPRIRLTNRETWLGGRSFEMKKAEEAREASGLDWEYHAAVLLERLPVVVPEPEDWEVAWMDFMSEFRWNCGRQYPAELDIWREDRDAPAPSFREQHEACPIPLAPRVTEADASGDRTTLHRALDRRIFLLERASDAEPWRFVTAAVQRGGSGGGDGGGGETLRAAAERALAAALRPDVPGFKYWHVGNGPAGVDWRIFGEEERAARGAFGEKVFLMRAQIVVGEPAFARRGVQRVWVAKEELAEYFGAERGQYYVKLL